MDVKSVEGFPAYEIHEDGKLFSKYTGRFLKPFKVGRKRYPYLAYKLCQNGEEKTFQAHRLVAKAFVPNPKGLETVNHIDGDRFNNHKDNLEWMTQQENKSSAFTLGISEAWWVGEKHPRSSFTEKQVHEICKKFQSGVLPKDLAKSTSKLYQKLFRIYNRDNWKKVSNLYNW